MDEVYEDDFETYEDDFEVSVQTARTVCFM